MLKIKSLLPYIIFSASDNEQELPAGKSTSYNIETQREVLQRLLIYLDCTSNATHTQAWDLLATMLRLLLMAGDPGRQVVHAEFNDRPRRDWWFVTHAKSVTQERELRCVAKQLTVYDLLLGPAHPLSRRLENWLSRRQQEEGTEVARSIVALLAERRAFALQVSPLFLGLQLDQETSIDYNVFPVDEEWVRVREAGVVRRQEQRPWFSDLAALKFPSTAEQPAPAIRTTTADKQQSRTRHQPFSFLRYRYWSRVLAAFFFFSYNKKATVLDIVLIQKLVGRSTLAASNFLEPFSTGN